MENSGIIQELEFDRLVKDKQFKELTKILVKILDKLNDIKSTDNTYNLERIEDAVKNITISPDNKLPKALELIGNAIINKIKEIVIDKPTEWTFSIERDYNGLIQNIKAKAN